MVDSLFSFQDAATDYGDLANELLTTVLDGCGSRWTIKTAHTSDDEVRRTALDPPGSAKPPEKRKVGGSTAPLTTTSDLLKQVFLDRKWRPISVAIAPVSAADGHCPAASSPSWLTIIDSWKASCADLRVRCWLRACRTES
jgi:hypothetical protein